MILEAFSTYLREHYTPQRSPEAVLHDWLDQQLVAWFPQPLSAGRWQHKGFRAATLEKAFDAAAIQAHHVAQVIQVEMAAVDFEGERWFVGVSPTGEKLLQALYHYCGSYDHWQFARWVHEVQASDFADA